MARWKVRASKAAAPMAPLTPEDLEKRYNFPAGDAAGQSVPPSKTPGEA